MIDKEYLQELQLDAYEILEYIYSAERQVSPEILRDYPFDMAFEELLAELDEIFEKEYHVIRLELNEKFGKDFLAKYIEFVNDAYFRMNNKISYR